MAASPARSPRTNPNWTNNSRDPDRDQFENRPSTRGLGIEAESRSPDLDPDISSPARASKHKLDQIIQNYHTKAALIILQARVDVPVAYKERNVKRLNKWFNVEVDETDMLRDEITVWRTCNSIDSRPPPLIVEIYLDTSQLTNNQSLVILDDSGKRWDVLDALSSQGIFKGSHKTARVVLERWRVELGHSSDSLPESTELNSILPTVYKKCIVLFRSLCAYSKLLPAWKFSKRHSKVRPIPALTLHWKLYQGQNPQIIPALDALTAPLHGDNDKVVDDYSFGIIESPAGPLNISVAYRTNCEFRVDDSEKLLSSRFMGADENFFKPSLPSEDAPISQEGGSLPVKRRSVDPRDLGLAYGSMSTFHGAGVTAGSSPISALRAARDNVAASPNSPTQTPQSPRFGPAARFRLGESNHPTQRRPSISYFKAPPLSASPVVDAPLGSSPRSVGSQVKPMSVTSETKNMPPASAGSRMNKPAQAPQESPIISPTSTSLRTAPVSKFSSSFSHRRSRLSSGAINKPDDDNISSGKGSTSSSTAHAGSTAPVEPGVASSSSLQGDEDNISDFLKMLDLRKDLLSKSDAKSADANTKRTSAALSRFQKMKDSNAVLSDSMSSSLLQRSSVSSSRQLPNVPPMAAGASISVSSSPGKAISPHTPHTPAIPSRLSSNSIVEYSHDDHAARKHHLSHEAHRSPLEEASNDESTLKSKGSTSNAIDIPTSPRQFIPSYRRSSSAAQRRTTTTVEDDLGDFLPFGMRSLSVGAEDRPSLSMSEVLRQQEVINAAPTSNIQQEEPQPRSGESNPIEPPSRPELPSSRSSSSRQYQYQPRFAHTRGRGSVGHSQSHASAASSLGRGNVPFNPGDTDQEPCTGSGSNSGISLGAGPRRGSGHRFSFNRHLGPGNFDEDEPLLFAMSDFGVPRRSLDEGPRDGTSRNDQPLVPSTDTRSRPGSRRGKLTGNPPGGFPGWR